MDQEEIMQQLQAAAALHNQGELDRAEAIYRQILAIDVNNFYVLNFYGCICRERKRYQEGIYLLSRAVSLQPGNPDSVYNLGNVFKDTERWDEAISCYEKALCLRAEFPEVLNNLGICLKEAERYEYSGKVLTRAVSIQPGFSGAWLNLGNTFKAQKKYKEAVASYRKAIEVKPDYAEAYLALGLVLQDGVDMEQAVTCYQKAIALKPDFADPYFALGLVLKEEGDVEGAIKCYRKAIRVKPDFADAYLNLGGVYQENGEAEAAADAFAEHYRLKPIAQSFSLASAAALQSLSASAELVVPECAEFIPSCISDAIPFGNHLMYVHIPKAGGVRFSNPIFECIKEMFFRGGWEKYQDLTVSAFGRHEFAAMASHRIDSAPMRDGIIAAFSSYDLPSLDFSFLTSHGVSSRELSLAMRDQFDVQPIRLATWRDPWERLKSALHYWYRTSGGDLDVVKAKIDQKDPFLDNAICRGCFSNFSSQLSPDELHDAQIDYLIDIGDFSVMNQVMSSFLSRCRLPNIVVNKKVNVTSDDKRMDADVADSLADQCVEAGFISLDCAPEIEQMVSRGLPAELDLKIDASSTSLHPLTFVVNSVTDVKTSGVTHLLPTNYLITGQGQEFLQKTFAK
ncbi:tetratricopeptide repeat protein [Synechococcus sp. A18-25c]|uniref:tetratricopeptide repeat protein n=1 Tax=Synechococcus sp. A18-25c TaxID=1866938 RepID=UPI0016458320|nr:tetratricopeptide repeat protein [Synechococcus sp. A18-25c]